MKTLDVRLLLATGAITGPYKRAKPITLSPMQRALRAVRVFLDKRKKPV